MRSLLVLLGLWLGGGLCLAAEAPCPPEFYGRTIAELALESTSPEVAVDDGFALNCITTNVGDTLTLREVQTSLRLLTALNRYEDIEVRAEALDGENIRLIYRMAPLPVIRRVRFKGGTEILPVVWERGNVEVQDLRRKVPVFYGMAYRQDLIDDTVEAIQDAFQGQGFFKTSVEVQTEDVTKNSLLYRDVTFVISLNEPTLLTSLTFQGQELFPGEDPRRYMSNRQGERFVSERLDDDLQRVQRQLGDAKTAWERIVSRFARGKQSFVTSDVGLDENIYDPEDNSVSASIRLDGGDRVRVQLNHKPTLWHWFRRFQGKGMYDVLPIVEEFRTDADLIDEGVTVLENLYLQRNFYDPQVSYTTFVEPEDETLVIAYDIDRGTRVPVKSFTIHGNEAFTDGALQEVILSGKGLGKNRFYNEETFESDVLAIRGYYFQRGYLDAQVRAMKPVFAPDLSRVDLQVTVVEGGRFFAVSVDLNASQLELDVDLNMERRSYFQRKNLDPDVEAISKAVLAKGAKDARVRIQVTDVNAAVLAMEFGDEVETNPDLNAAWAKRLTYVVDNAQTYEVGRVVITGLGRTRRSVVERELTFEIGDPYQYREILASQRRLYNLGIFERVFFETRERPMTEGVVDVIVSLREARAGLAEVGLGYFEQSGFVTLASFTYGNIGGRNRTLSLLLENNDLESAQRVSFIEPYLFANRISTRLTLSREEIDETNYDAVVQGGEITFSRDWLQERLRTSVGYRREDVDIDGFAQLDDGLGAGLSSVNTQTLYDSRLNKFNPTQGILAAFNTEFGPRVIGNTTAWWKAEGQYAQYWELGGGSVLAGSYRLGWGERLPITERYEVGTRVLRGFERDDIGPSLVLPTGVGPNDVSLVYVGGNIYTALNLEYRYPLYSWLWTAIFLEGGGAFEDRDELIAENIREDAGLGLVFQTPVGPLRMDYGFKLDRKMGESVGEFSFSIGHLF